MRKMNKRRDRQGNLLFAGRTNLGALHCERTNILKGKGDESNTGGVTRK